MSWAGELAAAGLGGGQRPRLRHRRLRAPGRSRCRKGGSPSSAAVADVAYPQAHRSLWRCICEQGLVLSELPPGTGAWRWTFPARNRIMAAIAGMTVVVEGARRSGSLITADLAADLGRDLGAVPGPVSSRASAGTERPARRRRLPGPRRARTSSTRCSAPAFARLERLGAAARLRGSASVLAAVEGGAETCDAVAAALDLAGAEAAAALADPRGPRLRRLLADRRSTPGRCCSRRPRI